MKKKILITFFSITNIVLGLSQFGYYVSSGLALSQNVYNLNFAPTGYLEEYFIQLSPYFTLNEKLSFSVNLQYIGKGSEDTNPQTLHTLKFRSTYVEALPEAEYSIIDDILLAIGFNYGILLKSENKNNDEPWNDIKGSSNLPSYDIGLSSRIQGEYKKFIIFGRYIYGLKDLTDAIMSDQNGNPLNELDFYNRTFQFGIGYKFL